MITKVSNGSAEHCGKYQKQFVRKTLIKAKKLPSNKIMIVPIKKFVSTFILADMNLGLLLHSASSSESVTSNFHVSKAKEISYSFHPF